MTAVRVLVFLVFVAGCVNDPVTPARPAPPSSARGVYILNEGGFGQGNATLSYYDIDSGRVTNDVFGLVNGRPLGDVGNGILVRDSLAFIIVNNSHRIEIIRTADHSTAGAIDLGAGASPRTMAFVNDSIALVTLLYSDAVVPLNVRSRAQLPRIPVGANPDGLAITDGKAYVANSGLGSGGTVSVIALASFAVTETIAVADNPVRLHVSREGDVYVLCAGSYAPGTPAAFSVIDPRRDTVVATIPLGGHVFEFALGAAGVGYVPVGDSILVLNTGTRSLARTFARGTSYYSLGIDPRSGDVYAGDAGDYIQPGRVSIFSSAGNLRTTFEAGVIPGSFAFR